MKDIERGIILFLIVLVIGSTSGLGYLYYNSEKTNNVLNTNYNTTLQKVEKLEVQLATKEDHIVELQSVIDVKNLEIEKKTKEIVRVTATAQEYKSALDEMNSYTEIVNQELANERINKIPDNYYSERLYDYPDSVEGLSDFLTYGFELPVSYSLNVFDCSESSAYLEWCLEKQGFDADICIGPTPFEPSTYHAWVMVNTSDGYISAVEATALTGGSDKWFDRFSSLFDNRARGLVYYDENDPVTMKYYEEFDYSFATITDAINSTNLEEWNWWEGAWGLN